MGNDILDTRGKILQAAIDIVGLKGEVTTREIAEKAGVNVAAINYYFGNKNNLLKEVENYYSGLLYDDQYEILASKKLDNTEKLIQWAKSLLNFMFKYPAIVGLIVNITTEDKSYSPVLIQKIYVNREIQAAVEDIIAKATGIKDKKILNYKYLQVFSGVLGPVVNLLVANTFGKRESIADINSPNELDEYINLLVNTVLKN